MRQRKRLCISFEDEAAVRDELRSIAAADAGGRSIASVIRAAVREYLAKHRQRDRKRPEASAA